MFFFHISVLWCIFVHVHGQKIKPANARVHACLRSITTDIMAESATSSIMISRPIKNTRDKMKAETLKNLFKFHFECLHAILEIPSFIQWFFRYILNFVCKNSLYTNTRFFHYTTVQLFILSDTELYLPLGALLDVATTMSPLWNRLVNRLLRIMASAMSVT